ncbi:MAG TPA: ABC transporter substrate-binding protein [Chloroflexota bacterium]|jgi:NitT/TauT family transport system substrate-binding protein
MRGSFAASILCSLLFCLALAACQPATGSPASAPPPARAEAAAPAAPAATPPGAAPASPAPPSLPVALTVHNFDNTVTTAIIQHGIEKGYYAQEGLDVTLQNGDASVGVQLLASGHVQFSTSVGSAMAAAVRGVPVKVVFVSADRPLWWMYASPAITSIADLRGKTIGVSSAGSSLTIVAKLIMERHGLGPDDVQYLNVASPQRLPALESGAVDAAFLVAPGNLIAAKAGLRELFGSADEGVLLTTEGLATSDDYLQSNAPVVRRMLRASVRSLVAMRANRADAIATVADFTGIDAQDAAQVYDFARPTWTANGTAESPALQQSIEIMKQVAEVTTPVDESQAYDLHLTREVAAELGAR